MFIDQYSSAIPPTQALLSQSCLVQNGIHDPMICKLPATDQAEYIHLMNLFAYSDDRNKRNLGMATFIKHLGMIHSFVCRGDSFDALRGMICGIEFGVNSFLINTSRLKKLMYRSKSCMNGCFQKLGYNVCKPSHDISTLFSQILPGVSSQFLTARQWCVRKAGENPKLSLIPNIKIEIVGSHQTPNQFYDSSSTLNSSSPPSSPISPLPAPPMLLNYKQKISLEHRVPSSLPTHFQPPVFAQPPTCNYNTQFQFSQNGIFSSDSSSTFSSYQQDFSDPPAPVCQRNKALSKKSMVGSLPIQLPPLLSVNEEDTSQPIVKSAHISCSNSSSLDQREKEPQFMFDISTLLNHEANHQDIRRMRFGQLPQLSC